MEWIGTIADGSAILTAGIAVWLWFLFVYERCRRRREVEEYLRLEHEFDVTAGRRGLRTIMHLSANLALSEEQLYEAIFSSKIIRVWTVTDDKNRAESLMFQYEPKAVEIRKRERATREGWVDRVRLKEEK